MRTHTRVTRARARKIYLSILGLDRTAVDMSAASRTLENSGRGIRWPCDQLASPGVMCFNIGHDKRTVGF